MIGEAIPGPESVSVSPEFGSVAVTVNQIVSGPQKVLEESGTETVGAEFRLMFQVAVSASEEPHLSVTV